MIPRSILAASGTSSELSVVILVGLVLFAASLISMAPLRRLRLPFTVAMMLLGFGVGLAVSLLPAGAPGGAYHELHGLLRRAGHPSHHLIFFVFLPALVFESAFNLEVRQVLKNLVPISVLAGPALLLSTGVTGAALYYLGGAAHGLTWTACLLLGALISATDPVAVVALFKDLGAPKRLGILVEGESLFNDGTAIVVVVILLGTLGATQASMGGQVLAGLGRFGLVTFGGIAVGCLLAWSLLTLVGRVISSESIEISLSLVLAYAAFVVSEHHLHVSGVMACVAAGLVAGSWGLTKFSPSIEHFLHSFWGYLSFVMNSLIFFLVGLVITQKVDLALLRECLPLLGVVVGAMLLARAAGVFGTAPLLVRVGVERISAAYQVVMFWGGLRGAVSLALALYLSELLADPAALTALGVTSDHAAWARQGEVLLVLAAGGVLFTLVVNALTMEPLIVKLGLDRPTPVDRFTQAYATHERVEEAGRVLAQLEKEGAVLPSVLDELHERQRRRTEEARAALEALSREVEREPGAADSVAALVALGAERREVLRRFGQGELTEPATKALLHGNDLLRDGIKLGQGLPEQRTVRAGGRLGHRLAGVMEGKPLLRGLAQRWWAGRLALDVEATRGLYLVTRTVERTLARLEEGRGIERLALARVQARYSVWKFRALERLTRLSAEFPEYAQASQTLLAERHLLRAEGDMVHHLQEEGLLTDKALAGVEEELHARAQALRGLRPRGLELDATSLLRRVPAFAGVGEAALRQVASRLVSRTFAEGDEVVREGDPGDSMFLVARGSVRITCQGEGGRRVHLASLAAGDFFGEQAAVLGGSRNATVEAATPVNLLELSRENLALVFRDNPDLARAVEASIHLRVVKRAMIDCPPLSPLSEAQRDELCAGFVAEDVAAGAALARAGELERLLYVAEGALREDGQARGPGALCGLGALSHGTAGADLVAETAARVLVLPREALSAFRRRHPATIDAIAHWGEVCEVPQDHASRRLRRLADEDV